MGSGWSILLGIAFLLGAAYLTQRTLEFRRHGEVVSGTVIAVEAQLSSDGGGLQFSRRATISYVPKQGGKALTMRTGWVSSWFGPLQSGDRVAVRYLPKSPEDAREDSFLVDWGGPLALILMGFGGLTGKLTRGSQETVWWRSSDD